MDVMMMMMLTANDTNRASVIMTLSFDTSQPSDARWRLFSRNIGPWPLDDHFLFGEYMFESTAIFAQFEYFHVND